MANSDPASAALTFLNCVSSLEAPFVVYTERDTFSGGLDDHFHHICSNSKHMKVSPEELRIVDTTRTPIPFSTGSAFGWLTSYHGVKDFFVPSVREKILPNYSALKKFDKSPDDPFNRPSDDPANPFKHLSTSFLSSSSAEPKDANALKPRPMTMSAPSTPGNSHSGPSYIPTSVLAGMSQLPSALAPDNSPNAPKTALAPPTPAPQTTGYFTPTKTPLNPGTSPLAAGANADKSEPDSTPPRQSSKATQGLVVLYEPEGDEAEEPIPPRPSPKQPVDVKSLLKPTRNNCSQETHLFTFIIRDSSISSYITLYPKRPQAAKLDDSTFEDNLTQLFSSNLDIHTLDAILDIVNRVMDERGEEWFNVDIKAWLDAGEARPAIGVGEREPVVKVMFTIAKGGETTVEDGEEIKERKEETVETIQVIGKTYGLEDDGGEGDDHE